jgi:RimJ/RimL family protein N-acetyltransferase
MNLSLRDIVESDLPILFEHQLDPVANHMAAFTAKDPTDRAAFMQHWVGRIFPDATTINKAILLDGQIVGNLSSWEHEGKRELCYWIDRRHWGKGIASQALSQFLGEVSVRPLYARAAKDNFASIRVLEKCGFKTIGNDRGFANARGEEIDEVILQLDSSKVTDQFSEF